jgi:replicative DNA helicase
MNLPQAVDAEQSVIGGLMLCPESLPRVADWLAVEDFYRHDHRLIYRSICEMAAQDKPFDVVTLGEWFEAHDLAHELGGTAYLIELGQTTPSAANITAYAEIVVEKSRLRSLIASGQRQIDAARALTASGEVAMQAQAALAQLAPTRATGLLASKPLLSQWFTDFHERYNTQQMPGLPYPWKDLNAYTHGMQPGEMTILAARSNTGKSMLALQIAAFTALRGKRVALFSLEMTGVSVMRRNVAALAGIPHSFLIEPSRDDWDTHSGAMHAAIAALKDAPLFVDDAPNLSCMEITARATRMHMQAPIDLIVVDHLHEMRMPGKQGEVIERGDAARGIKALAKRTGCPVLCLAQLNRSSETENRKPLKSDLRASGGIEEVTDVALLLHRPQGTELIEVIVAKGRDIESGRSVWLQGNFAHQRADDYDGDIPQAATPIKSRGMPG